MIVIGGGLAGSEAAWQVARRGVEVTLFEMRPSVLTPAHRTGLLAELVCSNSLGSNEIHTASGILKEELRIYGSMVIKAADQSRVPAGQALAVDRERFAIWVTNAVENHPLISVRREVVETLPEGEVVVIASGPLTAEPLTKAIVSLTKEDVLHFYDAVSPIVTADSLDLEHIFGGSRYERGTTSFDYLNAPMNQEEYEAFWSALVSAKVASKEIPKEEEYFEGCLPIEELARRGKDTLRYGPLKPVGLVDPRTGTQAYAVVQLRRENASGSLYSLVGFQTGLLWPEQRRVFRMIPGLREAEFVRYGVMHRNTFINAPRILKPTLEAPTVSKATGGRVFFAGQISGSEGYVEAIATGLLAGVNASRIKRGLPLIEPPPDTMLGGLSHGMTTESASDFQPVNASFALLGPVMDRIKPKGSRRRGFKAKREYRMTVAKICLERARKLANIMT
ncbi:MAG TPA: methylenetetrahydrofolate--tRNA-(uracil(54)-C(5))-methyltransferase (FADH(2)-oxidizing) TrmFO [Clostridia bacterium]|nr:methylenetetrahydrofolate--tRNA-(uracil(54)-C(5))-methyltransferase (FADH(2)-oxidizing) TrmFO [Clostridia bacterium]